MDEQLERLKKWIHYCAALLGGCFGAFSILQLSHFASAVTVNFIEVFTAGAQMNWGKSLLRLGVVIVYFVTLFLASWLPGRVKSDLRLWALLLDAASAVILTLLPETVKEPGVYLCIFTMGFQWSVFAGKRGYPCSTIFSTNNLRQFVDAWVQVRWNKDESQAPRMRIYGLTLVFYHLGVIAICLLWVLGCGQRSILVCLLPVALALIWLREDLRLRKNSGNF